MEMTDYEHDGLRKSVEILLISDNHDYLLLHSPFQEQNHYHLSPLNALRHAMYLREIEMEKRMSNGTDFPETVLTLSMIPEPRISHLPAVSDMCRETLTNRPKNSSVIFEWKEVQKSEERIFHVRDRKSSAWCSTNEGKNHAS